MEVAGSESILNGLHGDGDFSNNPHFLSPKTKFGVLEIRHLQANFTNQIHVDNGCCWCGEIRGHKTTKRAAFHTKYKFLFFVSILVAEGGVNTGKITHHLVLEFDRWFSSFFLQYYFRYSLTYNLSQPGGLSELGGVSTQ